MRKLRSFPLPHWGTLLSSLLIVAAYPPWDLHYFVWVCLIPWLYALSQTRTWRQAVYQGLWLSIFMSLLGFHWVAYVLKQFGDLPWIVAEVGLGLYSLIGQPQFLLFGAVFFILRNRSLKDSQKSSIVWVTLGLALFYTGLDWAMPKLFRDTLGHAFYSASWLRQAAEIGGAHLLTFVAMWVNLALFVLIENRKNVETRKTVITSLALPLILIAGLSIFGYQRAETWRERLTHHETGSGSGSGSTHQETLQAAIIQANIGDFEKVAAERGMQQAAEKILADYLSLSDQALALQKKPDIVIWPETAYASTYGKAMTAGDYSRDQRIETWVKNTRTPLLFGSYDRDAGKDYNTLFALSPVASPQLTTLGSVSENLQFYHKNILLMFGEYIPFQDAFPAIGQIFPQVANFGRGPGPEIIQVPVFSGPKVQTTAQLTSTPLQASEQPSRLIPASPAICYEVLFPNYVIEAARKGSRFILNITNDSWFGPYGEPHLHLALSTFRTIETRLPMVRATNTGFSALITQDGEIRAKSHLFEPEILNVSVPLLDSPWTLMKAWGDWFGEFALVFGAILLGICLKFRQIRTQ